MVPQFRNLLMQAKITEFEAIPEEEYKGRTYKDNLLYQLQLMFAFLTKSQRQAYDPTGFTFAFKDMDNKPTNCSIQMDCQEFLNGLFDRLET